MIQPVAAFSGNPLAQSAEDLSARLSGHAREKRRAALSKFCDLLGDGQCVNPEEATELLGSLGLTPDDVPGIVSLAAHVGNSRRHVKYVDSHAADRGAVGAEIAKLEAGRNERLAKLDRQIAAVKAEADEQLIPLRRSLSADAARGRSQQAAAASLSRFEHVMRLIADGKLAEARPLLDEIRKAPLEDYTPYQDA